MGYPCREMPSCCGLPSRFAAVILTFAPVFVQQRTWWHAQLLLLGAILTPGQRTVSSILRNRRAASGTAFRQLPDMDGPDLPY